LKLFIWANPYHVNYGNSGYFAVAETVDNARAIARSAHKYSYVEFDDGATFGATADALLAGEPTRVVDIPCGEWHEWSE
jgi:hypothetical protein